MSYLWRCSRHQAGFKFGHHPRKPIILNAWFQLWNMEPDLWWFGQQYLVFYWSCTLSEWPNYCQWLRGCGFSRWFAMHTARSVQSWFEEHEDALQHLLWLAQSPILYIIVSLWSVFESRVRSRFPTSSVKQLE